MTCILLVDLQKEFFSEKGILGKNHISVKPLIPNIISLIEYGRTKKYPIIWIRAEYDHQTKLEKPSHYSSKPCCVKGSELSDFCEEVKNI